SESGRANKIKCKTEKIQLKRLPFPKKFVSDWLVFRWKEKTNQFHQPELLDPPHQIAIKTIKKAEQKHKFKGKSGERLN
ncbi:1895_t:CDS:1, partial [Ambispora leptoticha]